MRHLKEAMLAFHRDESGDVVQTAIIIAIMAVIAVGGFLALKPKLTELFNKTGGELDKANQQSY